MKRRIFWLIGTLVCLIAGIGVNESLAAFYRYTDSKGVISFADDLRSVPEQYRAQATLVGETLPEEPEVVVQPSEGPEIEAAQAPSVPEQRGRLRTHRLILSGLVIGLGVIAIVALGRLHASERFKTIVPGARIVLTGGLILFLVFAHGRDVLKMFFLMTGKVDRIEQESAAKGKRAAEAMKKLDNAIEAVRQNEDMSLNPEKEQ